MESAPFVPVIGTRSASSSTTRSEQKGPRPLVEGPSLTPRLRRERFVLIVDRVTLQPQPHQARGDFSPTRATHPWCDDAERPEPELLEHPRGRPICPRADGFT